MINITIAQLQAFLAVVEARNFRRASHQLNITQSAVSARISELEKQIGVHLFHRTTREVSITPQGIQLAGVAERALYDLQETTKRLNDESKLQGGRVVVSTIVSVAQTFLPEVVKEFVTRHPTIHVDILDVVGNVTPEHVLSGEADFGIFTPVGDLEDLSFSPLRKDELFVVCDNEHPLSRRGSSVSLSELVAYDLVGPRAGMTLRLTIEDAFRNDGLKFEPRHQVYNAQTMLRLVQAGFGVAIVPDIFSSQIEAANLVKLAFSGGSVYRVLGIITPRGRSLSPGALALVQLLKAHTTFRLEDPNGTSRSARPPSPLPR